MSAEDSELFPEEDLKEWQDHFAIWKTTVGFPRFMRFVAVVINEYSLSLQRYAFDLVKPEELGRKKSPPIPMPHFMSEHARVMMVLTYLMDLYLRDDPDMKKYFRQFSKQELEISKEKLQEMIDFYNSLGMWNL